jgi:hypothetical protein
MHLLLALTLALAPGRDGAIVLARAGRARASVSR